jgi:type I restriction enzyme S subunit
VTNEYGHLLLHTYDLKKVFYGLGSGLRQNLDWTDFKYLPCVVPPLTEQAAIVRFLDHVDRRIRRYIRAKQRLIALLEEQKQAIIDRATTQGTDGAIPLKPSGVPWLGDIPRHWGVSRSRHLLSPRRQLALPDDVQLSSTQAYGVIPQAEYEQKVGRRVVKISLHLEKRRHVEQNDFVISMRSFQGGLERAWAAGAIRSSYVVLKPGPAVNVEYFEHLLKSKSYIRALQATADFIRDGQDLTYDDFKRVDLPLVPLEEQRGIAASVAKATAAIRVSMSRLEREVSLVGEYRTRLIADVVTGKFDVREAAARLPTETDEAEPPLAVDALEGVDGEGEGSELDAEGEGSADA